MKNLKELRTQYGLSQGELGKIVGLSRYTISLYEKEGVPENKRQIFMDVLNDDYMLGRDFVSDSKKEEIVQSRIVREYKPEYESNGKPLRKKFPVQVIRLPAKAQMGLVGNYYAEEMIGELETRTVMMDEPYRGRIWEAECTGESMYDGTERSLLPGDEVVAHEISRLHWKYKLNIKNWLYLIMHNERGILIKEIKEQNVETGELLLHSWNKDKWEYDDFVINMRDCYVIANVMEVKRKPRMR